MIGLGGLVPKFCLTLVFWDSYYLGLCACSTHFV